jgi:hypothetical protein
MEGLESRELLAVFTVRTSIDTNRSGISCSDPLLSLREAVACANAFPSDPLDTIQFNINTTSIVNLTNAALDPLNILLLTGKNLEIDGLNQSPSRAGERITISSSTGKNIFNMVPLLFGEGGGILEAKFENLIITGGVDPDGLGGSAIRNEAGIFLTLEGVTATANFSDFGPSIGGAISNNGNLTIVGSTIANNFALGGGGGIASNAGSNLLVRNSTISGNSTGGNGGGILATDASIVIEQSTISNNGATVGNGGGLALISGPLPMNVNITRSTIVNNTSQNGGGIFMGSGVNLILSNTIVAQNSAQTGPDISDGSAVGIVAQNSFIGTNAGNGLPATMAGNIIGAIPSISPGLGQLANNGGPTFTHLPLGGSLVVDRGSGARPRGVDQRGYFDPSNGIPDMGSVEASGIPPVGGDFDHDLNYNCADLNLLTAVAAAGNNLAAYDLNGDGLVDQLDIATWLSNAGFLRFGPGRSYLHGDANLDGVVDGSDFGIWNASKFTTSSAWCSGNFNGDGVIDGADFGIWNSNKFTASDMARSHDVGSRPWYADGTPKDSTRNRRFAGTKLIPRIVDDIWTGK